MSDFKSQAEIWQWLLDGGMVRHKESPNKYEMINGNLHKSHIDSSSWIESYADFRIYTSFSKYTEPKPKKEYWQWLDPFDGMVTGLYFDERGLSLNEGAKNSRFTVKLEHTKILL